MKWGIPIQFKACIVDSINFNSIIQASIITKLFGVLIFTKAIHPLIIMDNEYSLLFFRNHFLPI